uniref:Uncharacterized protein n=1 Tax=Leersia perrieri TaxID=77586 RepID=A0A0D9UWQ8_9ORYZ
MDEVEWKDAHPDARCRGAACHGGAPCSAPVGPRKPQTTTGIVCVRLTSGRRCASALAFGKQIILGSSRNILWWKWDPPVIVTGPAGLM